MNIDMRRMKNKSIISKPREFEIELKPHEIEGGYIYIPIDFRDEIKQKIEGDVKLIGRNNTFFSKIKMDRNGRIYTTLSDNKKINTLSDWFRSIKAAEGDVLKIKIETVENKNIMTIEHVSRFSPKLAHRDKSVQYSGFGGVIDLMRFSKEIGIGAMAKIISIGSILDKILARSIQRAYSPEMVCDMRINECISSIKNDPKLVMFFDEYWNSSDMRRLFSHKPIQLIRPPLEETNEEEQVGQFQLIDIEDIENLDQKVLELIKQNQLSTLTSKYHLLLERVPILKNSVEDLFSMLPEQKEDAQVNEKMKKQELNRILEFVKESLDDDQVQKELEELIIDVIEDPLPLIQSFIGTGLPFVIDNAKSKIEHVISVTGLTLKGYNKLIDLIAHYRLLTNAYRIYWCPHHDTNPFYLIAIAPIAKFNALCPHCNQQLKSMGVSYIDSRLFKFMRHKDGLMTIALAWYLQKKNIKWEANRIEENNEFDLIAHNGDRTIYIETKTLYHDNDLMAFRRKMMDGLKKFEIKKKKIEGPNNEVKRDWIFVVNLPSDVLAKFYIKSEEGIKIISVDDFVKTIA
jgi:hypothetical protein